MLVPVLNENVIVRSAHKPEDKNMKVQVVCFLLGNSPASELYMPTFRNTLSVPSS